MWDVIVLILYHCHSVYTIFFFEEQNYGKETIVCVCIPILVTTFPEWLCGTEPLPHTPGAVRPSSLCL